MFNWDKMNEPYNLPCGNSDQLLKWKSLCSFCGRTFVKFRKQFTLCTAGKANLQVVEKKNRISSSPADLFEALCPKQKSSLLF